jgi:limonene 1,2-monooxygenase
LEESVYTGVGAFLSPVHEPGQDPHLTFHRDLELVRLLDELNYDEAWFGEHHSMGWGTIGAPETVIAAASQITRQITLAHGVVPLSWHHPFHVATRAVHLDHLTRGRYVLGVGPGVPTDAGIFGIAVPEQRARLTQALPDVIELVNGQERVTRRTSWYTLDQARLQLPRYRHEGIEIAVASAGTSLTGPQLAGRHGLGLVSFGLAQPGSTAVVDLAAQWRAAEEAAQAAGATVQRARWRVAVPVYVAETRRKALAEVRDGFDRWLHGYWETAIGRDVSQPGVPRSQELEARIEAGGALVGSVEDVVEQWRHLQQRTGGFGRLLNYVLDWAGAEHTRESLDLLARHVAPTVTGASARPQESIEWAAARRAQRVAS